MRLLLNFLFHHLIFSGTMFLAAAAAPTIGAGDGGAGNGGGDGSGDGSGDAAGGGDAIPAGDEPDGGAALDDATDGTANTDDGPAPDPNASVDLGDGRQVPAKFKKLFDLAKAQGLDKEVKQLYFANQRLMKAFPSGVNGAIELAQKLEEVGGLETIESLQSDLQGFSSDAELFERGDPKWIESGFQDNPEAALKMFTHSLSYVADNHPEHYDHLIAKAFISDMDASLPVRDIHALLAGMKDNPQAQELAKKLAQFYNHRDQLSKKVPEKKIDAQSKALSDREAALEKKEMDQRYTEVNSQVAPEMRKQVVRTIEAEAKTLGIDLTKLAADYPGAFQGMMDKIHQDIKKSAFKDQRFLDKHYALVKKGDLKRAADAVNKKHEAIIPDIVRSVSKASGLFKGTGQKPKPGAPGDKPDTNTPQAGWLRVTAKPAKDQIDWSKTPTSMLLDSKCIRTDGKKVTWA